MHDNKIGFHLNGRRERKDLNQLLYGLDPSQNACQQVQSEAKKDRQFTRLPNCQFH